MWSKSTAKLLIAVLGTFFVTACTGGMTSPFGATVTPTPNNTPVPSLTLPPTIIPSLTPTNTPNPSPIPTATPPITANHIPEGTLEVLDKTFVAGWAFDADAPWMSIQVRFYVDAPPPQGKYAGEAATNISRQDVNQDRHATGLHGFAWKIPEPFMDGKPHTLYAYAVDALSSDKLGVLNGVPKNFIAPVPPTVRSMGQPYNIGAWYYTEWSSYEQFLSQNTKYLYGRSDFWGGVREHATGKDPWGLHVDYSNREPLLGFYDLADQRIIDAHIRQAASSGISFFAFYWYWNADENKEDSASTALHKFSSSQLKSNIKFVLAPIKLGSKAMTLAMWKNNVVPYMLDNYLTDSSYLKTDDGRPIVILFDLGFSGESDFITGIAELKSQVKARMGKDPMLLWLYNGVKAVDALEYFPNKLGTDGFACFQLSPNRPAEPYTETLSQWAEFIGKQDGHFHFPCASTGLDRRPWWHITWGWQGEQVNDLPYNTGITTSAFADHLSTIKNYLDAHPNTTARTLIIYAWNEWGESGIIEPSRVDGYKYLDTIKSVFGLTSLLNR